MIDDEQIISKYIDNNSIKKNCQYWNHIDTEDQLYIKDKFKHIENIKLSECLYMILHHLDNRPLCPICNKEIKLERFSLGYKTFCSNNCKYSDKGKQFILARALRHKNNGLGFKRYSWWGYKCVFTFRRSSRVQSKR